MSIHTYTVTSPATAQDFKHAIGDAIKGDACITVTAEPVADDISARRPGGEASRTFEFWVFTITLDNFSVNVQDVNTHEWARISVDSDAVTITIVD